MECKFINHGIALAYQETVKPCCVWTFDSAYKETNQVKKINFHNWHKSPIIQETQNLLSQNIWPSNCKYCKEIEDQGRKDSIRLNGISAYTNFSNDDIVLEIRPGSVCNFACQTCWPAASSRVYNYHKQANLIDNNIESKTVLTSIDIEKSIGFKNFDFLDSLKHRIKTIVLLGGEPFYDKSCLDLIDWWNNNTSAELIVFTNGSCLDLSKLESYKNPMVLVFSLDAIDGAAEYIRFGTDWNQVWSNYSAARKLKNVRTRVNITTSAYNFFYMSDLINLLADNWPEVVSFGTAFESHLTECVIPENFKNSIIVKLTSTIKILEKSIIEQDQKTNAINAIASIIKNLQTIPFNVNEFSKLKSFVEKMDRVKKIKIEDYCPFTADMLTHQIG
jgi:molybdenum cofactor biosynthesis enzyme MoaA